MPTISANTTTRNSPASGTLKAERKLEVKSEAPATAASAHHCTVKLFTWFLLLLLQSQSAVCAVAPSGVVNKTEPFDLHETTAKGSAMPKMPSEKVAADTIHRVEIFANFAAENPEVFHSLRPRLSSSWPSGIANEFVNSSRIVSNLTALELVDIVTDKLTTNELIKRGLWLTGRECNELAGVSRTSVAEMGDRRSLYNKFYDDYNGDNSEYWSDTAEQIKVRGTNQVQSGGGPVTRRGEWSRG